jgi:hypothetical protein
MGGSHKFAWDFETLTAVLKRRGFSTVQMSMICDVASEYQIDGEDWWRPFESLYVNARK